MTSPDGTNASATSTRTKLRYWQHDGEDRRWTPMGYVPVIGLAILYLIGAVVVAPDIEADITERVSQELDAAGIAVTSIQSHGQVVSVAATAMPKDFKMIKALAKATECETIFGDMTCPSHARVKLIEPDPVALQLDPRPHDFVVIKSEDRVTLTGEVPNIAEHDRLVALAGQRFGHVVDELSVSNEPATGQYSQAATQALAVAERLVNGRANWTDDQLHVTGVVSAQQMTAARAQFDAVRRAAGGGSFNVQVIDYAMECDKQFEQALSTATIRFATASAIIDPSSDELLVQLAEIASQCPGSLIVEGHTDSRGDAGMNQKLSMARAESVRDSLVDLGIDGSRLTAIGYGETRPVADNSTARGRELNRRIAIISDPAEPQ